MDPITVALFGNLGWQEILLIFLILLLFFGASALPKLFRSMGRSVREFKKAQDGLYDEMEKAAENEEKKESPDKPADSDSSSSADA